MAAQWYMVGMETSTGDCKLNSPYPCEVKGLYGCGKSSCRTAAAP